ncbi:MFS transporter [Nonomuraea rhodomycinica]|uniref:MFS transporter n=1 Tax=Nonomuraea rhodomycinica TaxID=1712872 RepID=A0A7Y6IUL7_9ACTN|nr:MFS transporter [Nonomuraea rhodomycinica]NUW43404.1 MFS transporter [Nonomuraea rhodomycinica]
MRRFVTESGRRSLRTMAAPLAVRGFRHYYLGQTASAFGDALTPLALAFAVLDLTGSPADLGIVVLSTRVPIIALTLVGGAFGDRFPRRGVMLLADVVRFLAHGLTAVLLLTGTAHLWTLVALQLVAGTGSALFNPAAVGLVMSLAGKERLQEANSLLSISRSATSIAALGAGGALVATVGSGWAVLVDALTFLVSAVFLWRLPRAVATERPPHRAGLLASIGEGVREVAGRPWLWIWIVHVALTNMIAVAPVVVLGPYVADEHLGGAPAWSAIGIGYAVGGLAGGVVGARWRPARPMAAALAFFLLMAPLPALLAVPAATWLLAPAASLAGLQLVVYNVLQTTTLQRRLPEELVARAGSVVMLGALVAAPLGMGMSGPLAAAWGADTVLALSAGLLVVFTLATLLVPAVWKVRDDLSDEVPGETAEAEAEAETPSR